MNKLVNYKRVVALLVILLLIIIIYLVFLYKLQIIEGDEYEEESQNNVAKVQDVTAARGNLLDRYGRLLVTNETSYNIVINDNELFEYDNPNEILLNLANFVESKGEKYTDTLPITKTPPFEYIEMNNSQKIALEAFLKAQGLDVNISAVELMSYLRTRFEIDNNYSAEDCRKIAGLRYEINVRYTDNSGLSSYIFVEDADMSLITALLENNFPAVSIQTSYVRRYSTDYAAHILGYTGLMNAEEYQKYKEDGYSMNATVGKDGVEKAFEKYLHGEDGQANIVTTKDGSVKSTVYTKNPHPGDNVYITFDLSLQENVEQCLASGVETLEASARNSHPSWKEEDGPIVTGAAAVVVNVKSGEPLAMASYPTYKLSTLNTDYDSLLNDTRAPLFNRTTLGTYTPGSTFKPCSAIAALSSSTIGLDTYVYCDGIFHKYEADGYAPQCWVYSSMGHGHGSENVITAIRDSCNVFFYTIGDEMGIAVIDETASKLGLGESTGIEINEDKGKMASPNNRDTEWYAADTVQAAIGQADSSFTPLQLAEYCAAVANSGTVHTASMLKMVKSYDNSKILTTRNNLVMSSLETSQANWDAVHEGMKLVAQDPNGSAYETFGNYSISVAAKTGTAQTGSETTNNAVFICYAPADDPEIAIALVAERAGAGASLAPIARDIMDYYFGSQDLSRPLDSDLTLLK